MCHDQPAVELGLGLRTGAGFQRRAWRCSGRGSAGTPRCAAGRTREFLGGDLVPRLGQAYRQVRADPPGTGGEHDHPVAGVDALVDVVGYQQDRDVTFPPHPQDQVLQVLPGLRVHRAERLVH